MPTYKYKAITNQGKALEGTHNARSEEEVVRMLRKNKYFPVHIQETENKKDIRDIQIFSKVNTKDIAVFCRQLYTMLNAGVTLINCLEILHQQTGNKKLKQVIGQVYETVQKGFSFSEALKKQKSIFPDLLINMVEAGEASGNLDTIMDRMATHYEKEFKINNKIKNAMVYPIILSIVSMVVVIFLLTFVMPTFIEMFEDSGAPLPTPTRILLSMSNFLQQYWYLLIGIFIILVSVMYQIVKTHQCRLFLDKLQLKLPILRGTTEKIVTSRFTRTLATLSASGVPLLQSLEIVSNIVGNKVVGNGINRAKEEVRKGTSLYKAIKDIHVFPPMVISMIQIGEESGSLEQILDKTASFYDDELEAVLQKLTTMIEPLMIVAMAIVIGFIVISMMLPMFDMFNTIAI